MNILIIDDDVDDTTFFCEIVSETLPMARCIVENDCKDFLSTMTRYPYLPELIFIDGFMRPLAMPECLTDIKNTLDCSHTTFIVFSGLTSERQVAIFKKQGADEVVCKSATFEELRQFLLRYAD